MQKASSYSSLARNTWMNNHFNFEIQYKIKLIILQVVILSNHVNNVIRLHKYISDLPKIFACAY